MWMGTLLALWTGAAVCCPSLGLADEKRPKGEHLLPPETYFFLSVSDVPHLVEHLQETAYGKMFVDAEMQPFRQQVGEMLKQRLREVERELNVTWEDLKALPQGEVTLAVVEKPARKLAGVLLLDCTGQDETVNKLLQKMTQALKQEGAQVSTQDVQGVEVQVFALKVAADNPIKTLAYFHQDGYLVLSNEVAALKAVLERWDGKHEDTLAEADVFTYIQKKCSHGDEEPLVKWHLDVVGLIKTAVSLAQGQNPQAGLVLGMLPILGLDKFKGVGGGLDFAVEDFDGVSKTFFYVEQPPTGILGLFQFPAQQLSPPDWVAADVGSYTGLNWNVEEAYLAVESIIDSFQGPGALAKLLESYADSDEGPGMHLKKDLLDQLTGRVDLVSAATTPQGDMPVPAMLFALGLKQSDQMQRTLAKATQEGFPGKKREINGHTVYELTAEGANSFPMFITVAADALVLTTEEGLLGKLLRGNSRNALVNSPDYAKLARHFPKQTSIISYQKADEQLQSIYEMLKQQNNERIDLSQLPDLKVFQKYLRPAGSYTVPDKKGALMVSFTLAD